ncbi:translation initiation factor IF-2-like [Tympanuchus pallidicinctus]|uniref:translation initiation factor IF-2-like n=1 Tax=Tympanuchus pallidicinctus TaxID=109042 RepID=UPI0022874A28|nr:translation initiation factor IF-2-like [Tympanuchus pallidicinctus]
MTAHSSPSTRFLLFPIQEATCDSTAKAEQQTFVLPQAAITARQDTRCSFAWLPLASHGVQADQPLFYSPISLLSGRCTQVPFISQPVPRRPACRHSPARPISAPLPRLSPAFRLRAIPKQTTRGGGRSLPPGRGGSDMAAEREGEGAREPPGGWSQAAPPEPAASRRVQTSGSWRAAARLGAVPPAPGASARARAQARRRQVRALSLAAGGLLRCGAAPLEPAGARFGNKQQRAVFPNPSAPAAGRGVGVCARGEARREAGCGHEFLGSSPTRCRRRPRRVCRPESSGASRRPGVSVETGGERRPHPGGTLQPGRVGG